MGGKKLLLIHWVVLFAVLILSLVGCSDPFSRKEDFEDRSGSNIAKEGNDVVDKSKQEELERLRAEIDYYKKLLGHDAVPVEPGRGPDVPAAGKDPFEDYREEVSLEEQHARTVAAGNVVMAKGYVRQGDLNKALELAREAVKLDPTNEEALTLYNELNGILGHRPGKVKDFMDRVSREEAAKRMQAQLEIERRFQKGRRHFDSQEYDEAITVFNSTLELIRVQPYGLDLDGLENQLEVLINLAQKRAKEREIELEIKRKQAAEYLEQIKEQKRQENLKARINGLFQQAKQAFMAGAYEKCERLCDKILREIPGSNEVKKLREAAIKADQAARYNWAIETKVEEWRDTFRYVDEIAVPDARVVSFPEYSEWDRINRRADRIVDGHGAAVRDEGPVRLLGRLAEHKLPTFNSSPDQTLQEVFETLSSVTGQDIIVSLSDGEDNTAPNLRLRDISALRAVEALLRVKNLAYYVEDDVLYVTTPDRAQGETVIHTYEIGDLMFGIQDFPSPQSMGAPEKAPDIAIKKDTSSGSKPLTADEIVSLIRSNVEPASWDDFERTHVEVRGNTLLVKNTRRVHQEVDSLLNYLRSSTGILVYIESRFLTVSENFLQDIGVDYRGLGANTYPSQTGNILNLDDFLVATGTAGINLIQPGIGTGADPGFVYNRGSNGDLRSRLENLFDRALTPANFTNALTNSGGMALQFVFLDDIQLEAILRSVHKTARGTILAAPNLTLFNAQRANVNVTDAQNFIQDYDTQVATNAAMADPIIGTLRTGISLDVRPLVDPDKKYVTLELRTETAQVKTPVRTEFIHLAPNVNVNLELPEVEVQQLRSTVRLPDGGVLIAGGFTQVFEEDLQSSIPLFAQIPILNFFFKRQARTHHKSTVVVIAKVRIIDLAEEAAKVGIGQ